jgi:hypothetical protein
MLMEGKIIYPFRIGGQKKSLAITLRSRIVKKWGISTSTAFLPISDYNKKRITLQMLRIEENSMDELIPAGESLAATSQQVSPADTQ